MEVRDLLNFYEYDGDNGPVISGSALGALNGEAKVGRYRIGINGSC
jgi:elongation factor Tu